MKIALAPISLRSYRGNPAGLGFKEGIKTMLRRVKDIGYDGIEMGAPSGFSVQEYKEYMDEIGLEITSAGTPGILDREDLTEVINNCKILNAKNIMISAPPPIVLGNPYELEQFIKKLNRVGKELIAEGIHLSYHNHAIDFAKIMVQGNHPQ
jgi:sugar phosphate isomerase/epimerase